MPAFLRAQTAAQCENTKRTYADFQGTYRTGLGLLGQETLSGAVLTPNNAVDGDVKNSSTLSVPIGAIGTVSTTQYLEFTTNKTHASARLIPAVTPVTIKVALPKELLGLVSGIEIGSYNGLTAVSADWSGLFGLIGPGHSDGFVPLSKEVLATGTNLAGVIGGDGETEITITPQNAFNGVYIKLNSLLSLGLSVKVFHAYIMEPDNGSANCDEVVDVISGVKPVLPLAVLNITGSVTDPRKSIDKNDGTFAKIDAGLSVLSTVYMTAIWNKPSQGGDMVSIILENPDAPLLDLKLLSGFVIQPYLGSTAAGPAFQSNSTFLNLNLFPNANDNRRILTFPVTAPYDRIEIRMGGVGDLLNKLNVYEIKRTMAKPTTVGSVNGTDEKSVCQGSTASFTITDEQACTEYRWYDAEIGGNEVGIGKTFIPLNTLPPGVHNYYVRANRTYCITTFSDPFKLKLTINPLPPLLVNDQTICDGGTASIQIINANPGKYDYFWYDAALGGNLIGDKVSSYQTQPLSATTKYYLEAIDKITGCKSGTSRAVVKVNVKPYTSLPAISGDPAMCSGTVQTLHNGNPNGIWSTSDATIATVDATGKVTAVAAGNVVISYNVADDVTYCGKKVDFNLAVNPLPNLTLAPDLGICEGLTSAKLLYTDPLFAPVTYSISWTTGPILNVSDQTLPADEITINVPSTTPVAVYQGVLTIKNAKGCQREIPFSFRVKLVPHKPIVSIN